MPARVTVRDNALWLRHIAGAADLQHRLGQIPANARIALKIDGKRIVFRRMRNGSDGRPTFGLRPDEDYRALWAEIYEKKRGEALSIEEDFVSEIDPYLTGLEPILSEWMTQEDSEAFDDL
jgi:hypothetical protein